MKIKTGLSVLVIGLSAFLRFCNLGYSEYIPDEVAVLWPLRDTETHYSIDYLLGQRKGPVQYLVTLVTFFVSRNVYNEFVMRVPFAVASVLAIYFFYKFAYEETKNYWIGLISALVLGANGFILAFGRIVQYQSLNLLFSSIVLYLFAKKKFVGGTLAFCLSFLAHWDAIFILPVLTYLFIQNFDKKALLKCLGVGLLVLGPFMIPYTAKYFSSAESQAYASSRVGISVLGFSEKFVDYTFKTELYNPFIYIWFISFATLFAVFSIKRNWIYFVWFFSTLVIFLIFIHKPGTHVYNFFLPLSLLSGIGVWNVINVFPKWSKVFPGAILCISLGFLYYQSYVIFVDNVVEYPWQQEKFTFRENIYKTKSYSHENLTNNIIGFPLRRNWEEINGFLVAENTNYAYITNEVKSIAGFYIDLKYAENLEPPYYAVGVKRPLSFVKDYKFSQIKGKYTIKKIQDKNDDTLVRIYLVGSDEK
ncbi:hypothetical protein OAL67_00580 [bacterium]|nr:hypothetical protein [bacterium]